MKQILPVLFLFFCIYLYFPSSIQAVSVTINSFPSSISSDIFVVEASVSGATNATNYLRIDLYKEGTNNYFGETYNGSDWYFGSEGKSYFPIQVKNSSASATIQAQIGNPSTNDYPGPGTYKMKIRRYTSSGSSSSNDTQTPVDVQLTYVLPTPTPTESPTPTSTPTLTNTPSPTQSPTPTKTPTPTVIKTTTPTLSKTLTPSPNSPLLRGQALQATATPSSILGSATTSSSVIPANVVIARRSPQATDAAISDIKSYSNPTVLKYTFIFGAILSTVSGGWLYFRHKKD